LRANPSEEGVSDAERATNLKILQPLMGLRYKSSLSMHGSGVLGEHLLDLIILGVLNKGLSNLRNGGKAIIALNKKPRLFPSHHLFFLIFFSG